MLATRAAMGELFEEMAEAVPNFIGGAADLVESTKTEIHSSTRFSKADRTGRNIAFGIREHAMGAAVNGMAAHGGLRPYGATFFVFSDYMRPAIRISALMEVPSIWVYTHESVFLGEDGPTHQPIEHLASLRAMPGIWVVRPADAGETVEAWEMAFNRNEGPTVLLLTRQARAGSRPGRERGQCRPRGIRTSRRRRPGAGGDRVGGVPGAGNRRSLGWFGSGGQPSVLGGLRPAGIRLSGRGARRRHPEGFDRGRSHLRMGADRRGARSQDRH